MGWGETGPERITVLCCAVEGCGHKQLGAAISARFCPTHNVPLTPLLFELVSPPGGKRD